MFVLKDNAFNKCAVVIVVVVVVVVYEMFFVFVFYSVRIVELNTPSLKCAIRNSHWIYSRRKSLSRLPRCLPPVPNVDIFSRHWP